MNKSTKKIIITVAALVAVLAIVIAVLSVLGGREKDEPVTMTEQYSASSDAFDTQNVTVSPTVVPADGSAGLITSDMQACMDAYLKGIFYISGETLDSSGGSTLVTMAKSGSNLQMDMEIEGIDASVLIIDGDIYLIDLTNRKYLEMSSAFMGIMGVDISDLEEEVKEFDSEGFSPTGMQAEETTLDGEKAVCCRYYNDSSAVLFYFVDGQLKRIDCASADGTVTSSTVVYDFSPSIPTGMLTLSGYEKSDFVSFMKSFF